MFFNMNDINYVFCKIIIFLLENLKVKFYEDSLKGKEWNMGKFIIISCEGYKVSVEE